MQPTFARVKLATLDPFIHMNQDGRVRTPPEARGHPLMGPRLVVHLL
jgi:hypothetical protein